jgi:hypothetical protein
MINHIKLKNARLYKQTFEDSGKYSHTELINSMGDFYNISNVIMYPRKERQYMHKITYNYISCVMPCANDVNTLGELDARKKDLQNFLSGF